MKSPISKTVPPKSVYAVIWNDTEEWDGVYLKRIEARAMRPNYALCRVQKIDLHPPASSIARLERAYIAASVKLYENPSLYLRELRMKALEAMMNARRRVKGRLK